MSTSSRAYHHGDLPAAILASAGKMMEKQGLESLNLRALARRARVSHSAPYRHFPERQALLAALAAEGFAMLGKVQEEAGKGGARERGLAYVRFALQHPQRFRLMFSGLVHVDAYPGLRSQAASAYEGLVRSFAPLSDPRAAEITAAAAWSLVHGMAQLLLDGHFARATREGRDVDAFVRDVLGAIRFAARPAQPE